MSRLARFLTGFWAQDEGSAEQPGLIYDELGRTYVIAPDGTRTQLPGSGGSGEWGQASTAHFHGSGSPVGLVVPSSVGDLYTDETTPALYQATGLTNADWQAVGGGSQTPVVFAPAVAAEMTTNLDLEGAATVDDVVLATGDRVLLRAQDDPTEDGLWVVNTAGAWTRPDDFADGTVVANGSMFIVGYAGSVWQASVWLLNTDDSRSPAIVGTDHFDNIDPVFAYQVFSISAPGSLTPGTLPAGVFGGGTLVAYGATIMPLGEPAAPLDGIALFVDSGVLKGKLPNGDVVTFTVS